MSSSSDAAAETVRSGELVAENHTGELSFNIAKAPAAIWVEGKGEDEGNVGRQKQKKNFF